MRFGRVQLRFCQKVFCTIKIGHFLQRKFLPGSLNISVMVYELDLEGVQNCQRRKRRHKKVSTKKSNRAAAKQLPENPAGYELYTQREID